MRHLLAFCLLFLLLVSCATIRGPVEFQYTRVPPQNISSPRVMPVYVDINFGAEDKVHIDDSLNRWNYALNGYIYLQLKSSSFNMSINDIKDVMNNHGLMIIKVDSLTCNFIPGQKNSTLRTIAWAEIETRTKIYVVRDRVGTQDIFEVMLHEIGHILGADHTGNESLMYRTYTPDMYVCIDRETMEQVAAFNHLPMSGLNYCHVGVSQENVK